MSYKIITAVENRAGQVEPEGWRVVTNVNSLVKALPGEGTQANKHVKGKRSRAELGLKENVNIGI